MESRRPSTLAPHPINDERTVVRPETDAGAPRSPYPDLDLESHGPKKSYWWVWVLILGAIAFGCYRLYVFEAAKQSAMARPSKALAAGARAVPVVGAAARIGNMPVYLDGLGTVTASKTVTVRPRE